MSTTTPLDELDEKRQEILAELWALVGDLAHPGSVQVAALDKIAKIEGAYKPKQVQRVNKFTSLADFYAKTKSAVVDIAADVTSEASASSVPSSKPTQPEPTVGESPSSEDDDEDGGFGFL